MKGSDLISWVPAFTKISLNGFSPNFYTQKSVLKKYFLEQKSSSKEDYYYMFVRVYFPGTVSSSSHKRQTSMAYYRNRWAKGKFLVGGGSLCTSMEGTVRFVGGAWGGRLQFL